MPSETASSETNSKKSIDDLPESVRERIYELPPDVWAGQLEDKQCRDCGHNSWFEVEDQLGYSRYYNHMVEAYECLFCGSRGGRIIDARSTTPFRSWLTGSMESTVKPDWAIDPDNPPWEDDEE